MADKSEDKDSLGLGGLCIGIFFLMGVVQLWLMVSAVSNWVGSNVLALIISFIGTWIPIPWFLIGHWYFEGTLPWGYIAAWVVGWGAMFFTVLVKNPMFITTARWVLSLPAGVFAAFFMQMFTDVAFGLGYGFETVHGFYDSPDMAGMPVSGTFILLVTRITTAAILLYTTIVLVPNYKRQAAVILIAVLSMLSIGWFIYLVWSSINMNYTITTGMWYRLIFEGVSLFLGMVVGAKIAITRGVQTSG